jgi:hypothetical protein
MYKVSGPIAAVVTKRATLVTDDDGQHIIIRAHPGELKMKGLVH